MNCKAGNWIVCVVIMTDLTYLCLLRVQWGGSCGAGAPPALEQPLMRRGTFIPTCIEAGGAPAPQCIEAGGAPAPQCSEAGGVFALHESGLRNLCHSRGLGNRLRAETHNSLNRLQYNLGDTAFHSLPFRTPARYPQCTIPLLVYLPLF